jgi:hypothetical protein
MGLKKITDKITPQIAALYLGQKCDVRWEINDFDEGAFSEGDVWHDSRVNGSHINRLFKVEITLTLYLRPLSSLTEEEAQEIYLIRYDETWENSLSYWITEAHGEFPKCLDTYWGEFVELYQEEGKMRIGDPAIWLYLLGKGFDLLGLIEQGLAKNITSQQ